MRPEARHRGRLGARRLGRAPPEARRSRRRARQPGRRRRPLAGGCDRPRELGPLPVPGGARLASCRAAVGERPTMGAISSKGTSNMSCSTKATRSAGASLSSTTSSARPTASARSASCWGSIPSSGLTIGSGTRTPKGSSRRDLRERSMSRHTRATTVVSHPRRFSTPLVSARLRRSQVSWTASSASLSEPSIR
jgi:hypothetical protein